MGSQLSIWKLHDKAAEHQCDVCRCFLSRENIFSTAITGSVFAFVLRYACYRRRRGNDLRNSTGCLGIIASCQDMCRFGQKISYMKSKLCLPQKDFILCTVYPACRLVLKQIKGPSFFRYVFVVMNLGAYYLEKHFVQSVPSQRIAFVKCFSAEKITFSLIRYWKLY